MKFLKQLLGVQTQTSNIGVLLETGRVPLMAYALKNAVNKQWFIWTHQWMKMVEMMADGRWLRWLMFDGLERERQRDRETERDRRK